MERGNAPGAVEDFVYDYKAAHYGNK